MNNIITNFDQILGFAKSYGLPLTKKRAVLREYLQVKILDFIYQRKLSPKLFFVGGTCLRLLYGLDRFSEDLDFDMAKNSRFQIKDLMQDIYQRLLKENIEVDFYKNITSKCGYYELRFKNLLYDLKLSTGQEEKLTIKFDFESFWQRQKREVVLLNRYGFLVNIVTIPRDQMLVQKIFAYTKRKQTLPRDIYDIVWLAAQGVKIDKNFVGKNDLSSDLISRAREKFEQDKLRLRNLKLKLKPFLLNENYVEKLDLFLQILKWLED